jgi:acetyl-CoA carboxylase carboxyl transferase subunit beta
MAARAARGARCRRCYRGGGLAIRAWISKRREYSRSGGRGPQVPDTESGLASTDGVFTKCESCGEPTFEIRDDGMLAGDPMGFEGYEEKLVAAREKTGLDDAVLSGTAKIGGHGVALAAMDFRFIGGSMGSVVGERIARTMEFAYDEGLPLVIVSSSGGARMFEGVYSLMQMAKTSVALNRYMTGSLPYVSILADPTFGGVTASFATAADVVIAEPKARIGFAGARVIESTTKERLPEGFQTAEFQKEHGLVDRIVHRLALKNDLERFLRLLA